MTPRRRRVDGRRRRARRLLGSLGYEQQPLYYCASCGGYYSISHFE
jgi:hypothetical protein